MTSLQIQYFLTVAEYMSFSGAAEALFVAQSSVSRQVQQLEKELGFELFDRHQRRELRLTEAGIAFRDYFRRIFREYEQLHNMLENRVKDDPLQLRVGVGQNWNLTDSLLRFREQVHRLYPKAELTFVNLPFLKLHKQLQNNQLDVIITTRTSVMEFDQYAILEIGQLEGRAYVRKGLLRPADQPMKITDFQGQTLLMLPEEEVPMSLQIVQLQFLANQVPVKSRRLPTRDSIHQAVLMGEGFTVLDNLVWLGTDPALTWLPLQETIPICMIWKRAEQNPLIHMLADVMLEDLERKQNG